MCSWNRSVLSATTACKMTECHQQCACVFVIVYQQSLALKCIGGKTSTIQVFLIAMYMSYVRTQSTGDTSRYFICPAVCSQIQHQHHMLHWILERLILGWSSTSYPRFQHDRSCNNTYSLRIVFIIFIAIGSICSESQALTTYFNVGALWCLPKY